jgi:hypothetical protein
MGSTLELGDSPVLCPCRFGDGILARVFRASLDEALAAGWPPETSRLLAARARLIVSLPERAATARNWEHVLLVAHRSGPARRVVSHGPAGQVPAGAVPVRADQVVAAEPAIRDLMNRLTAQLPVPARGVAMARVLLTDAASPVYSRRARIALTAALEAAAAQLDPALPLMSSSRG